MDGSGQTGNLISADRFAAEPFAVTQPCDPGKLMKMHDLPRYAKPLPMEASLLSFCHEMFAAHQLLLTHNLQIIEWLR